MAERDPKKSPMRGDWFARDGAMFHIRKVHAGRIEYEIRPLRAVYSMTIDEWAEWVCTATVKEIGE